uniref:Uncharacterized protein n=1 Tax=Cannabis sativa TaxID=3483 RepID=A0A803RB76_CANSA
MNRIILNIIIIISFFFMLESMFEIISKDFTFASVSEILVLLQAPIVLNGFKYLAGSCLAGFHEQNH